MKYKQAKKYLPLKRLINEVAERKNEDGEGRKI
jgi:hypothetical protein